MKKLIISFLFLFLFSACLKPAEDNLNNRIIEHTQTGKVIVASEPVEGVLKAQEVKLDMYGTHLLEDEMGAFMIYLQSKKINLSSYLDAKVRLEGEIVETFDGKKILEVNKVDILSSEPEEMPETKDQMYISQKLGINLTLPAKWEKEEVENELNIYVNANAQLLKIIRIENEKEKDLESFVDESEKIDLTINQYEAIRTMEGEIINLYLKGEGNIYKIIFTPIEKDATEKSQFYAILKTFSLNQKTVKEKTKVCGGAGKIKCDTGYRCEISSEKELATGLCVKVESLEEENIVEENLEEKTEDLGNNILSAKEEKFQVIDYINANVDELTIKKEIINAQVESYEFSENSVVSVILKNSEKKYKIQYQYEIVDEFEVVLNEVAYFEEGDGRDWEKISGEDQQSSLEKEVVTGEGETQAVVYEDMRFYENSHQNYSLQYPRSWYYSSFGAIDDKIWHVGFSDQEVELGNEKISVDILSGKVDNLVESDFTGLFKISLPRDDDTHIVIYGDRDMEEMIRKMAETISLVD